GFPFLAARVGLAFWESTKTRRLQRSGRLCQHQEWRWGCGVFGHWALWEMGRSWRRTGSLVSIGAKLGRRIPRRGPIVRAAAVGGTGVFIRPADGNRHRAYPKMGTGTSKTQSQSPFWDRLTVT